MKICACVAEYNPLHLGHLKHIDYMKTDLRAEKIIVVMSGNFTQRGEPAVMNKYKRARQAIIAGADAVIELPVVFATGNAETFARGAVNLVCDMNVADGLCFGAETADKNKFITLARSMNDESKEFKKALKEQLSDGVSLAKAKFLALKSLGRSDLDESLISSPNNILGLEYTKALLKRKSDIEIYPLLREGSDHNDAVLKKGITSATSIRSVIRAAQFKKLKKSLPPFVYGELNEYPFAFDKMIMTRVITSSADELAEISDCTEGLENRIKALSKDNRTVDALVEKVATKRYPATRIRRILTANLLGIKNDFVKDCLDTGLYAKVLAVNSSSKDVISLLSEKSSVPVLTRKSDSASLKKLAAKSFEYDALANDLYNLATDEKNNEYQMLIV